MSWAFEDEDVLCEAENAYVSGSDAQDDEGFDTELEALGLGDTQQTELLKQARQAVAGSGYRVARKHGTSNRSMDSFTDQRNDIAFRKEQILAAAQDRAQSVLKPLPLMHFTEENTSETKHIFECEVLKCLGNSFQDSPDTSAHRALYDPHRSLLLKNYFTSVSLKEIACKENTTKAARDNINLCEEVVYVDKLFGAPTESTTRPSSVSSALRPTTSDASAAQTSSCEPGANTSAQFKKLDECQSSLKFDGEFESGNIDKAVFVTGRDRIRAAALTALKSGKLGPYVVPTEVDAEYDITIRSDIGTSGNIQWFYFSASAPEFYGGEYTGELKKVSYPLRVRFQLVNMEKNDSLYNYGMRPVCRSEKRSNLGWVNVGEDICYFKNGRSVVKKVKQPATGEKHAAHKYVPQYSMVFTYTFDGPDTVYFAHAFPYTYSDLQKYLYSLEQDQQIRALVRRRTMCLTLAGNRCDMLTITGPCSSLEESESRPAIIISARVHPGETNSSFMMHGIIEYLISDSPAAVQLRQHYVFKIIPMLNPDGVIHGNYRCSLFGADLNRKYLSNAHTCYPTVVALRNLILTTQRGRGVAMFLDLHGHSKKKNAFVYGCDVQYQSDNALKSNAHKTMSIEQIDTQRLYTRVFPHLLSRMSDFGNAASEKIPYFSYSDCCFSVAKSKTGTGRVVAWNNIEVQASYTIELSFCGPGNNAEVKILRKALTSFVADKANSATDDAAVNACSQVPKDATIVSNAHQKGSNSQPVRHTREKIPTKTPAGATGGELAVGLTKEGLEVRDLLDTYQRLSHYSKNDLRAIGVQTMLALYYYSNLDIAQHKVVPPPALDSYGKADKMGKMTSVDVAKNFSALDSESAPAGVSDSINNNAPDKNNALMENAYLVTDSGTDSMNRIQTYTAAQLTEAIVRPTVFSQCALKAALERTPHHTALTKSSILEAHSNHSDRTSLDISVRLQSEIAIRKMLKLWDSRDDSLLDNHTLAQLNVAPLEEANDEMGSDSDPSVNNMSEKDMLKALGKKKSKNKGEALRALRLASKMAAEQAKVTESEALQAQDKPPRSTFGTKEPTKSRASSLLREKKSSRQSAANKSKASAAVSALATYVLDENITSSKYDPIQQLQAVQKAQCSTLDLSISVPLAAALVPSLSARTAKSTIKSAANNSSLGNNQSSSLDSKRRRSFDFLTASKPKF